MLLVSPCVYVAITFLQMNGSSKQQIACGSVESIVLDGGNLIQCILHLPLVTVDCRHYIQDLECYPWGLSHQIPGIVYVEHEMLVPCPYSEKAMDVYIADQRRLGIHLGMKMLFVQMKSRYAVVDLMTWSFHLLLIHQNWHRWASEHVLV